MNQYKRIVRGTIPYYLTKLFSPESDRLRYLDYIRRYGYRRHVYECRHRYDDFNPSLLWDSDNALYYVEDCGKRLYFKRDLTPDKIRKLYKELVIEQDPTASHHYFDDIHSELSGRVLIDVGASEGMIALRAIDEASHIVLMENDPGWIEALRITFAPYRHKITMIEGTVCDVPGEKSVTIDSIVAQMEQEKFFLKMDIEGFEPKALRGASTLLTTRDCKFAVCTYHGKEVTAVCSILDGYGCQYRHQYGYFCKKIRSVMVKG